MTNFVPFERRSFSGVAPDTSLSSGVDNVSLTLAIADGTGWPDGTGGRFIVILEPDTSNEEKCLGQSRSGNTVTLAQRGLEGTAAPHTGTTTVVRHGFAAIDADEANHAVNSTIGKVQAAGDLLVGTGAGAIGRLPVGAMGTVATSTGTGISWSATSTSGITSFNTRTGPAITFTLADASSVHTASGQLLVGSGLGTAALLGPGSSGQVLTSSGSTLSWVTPSGGGSTTGGLLKVVSYYPGTGVALTVGSNTTLTALDTTNLRATFTAPTSGNVIVRLTGIPGNSTNRIAWGLTQSGTPVGPKVLSDSGNTGMVPQSVSIYVTGLSGSVSLDWAGYSPDGTVAIVYAGSVAPSGTRLIAPAVMEVLAAP